MSTWSDDPCDACKRKDHRHCEGGRCVCAKNNHGAIHVPRHRKKGKHRKGKK